MGKKVRRSRISMGKVRRSKIKAQKAWGSQIWVRKGRDQAPTLIERNNFFITSLQG